MEYNYIIPKKFFFGSAITLIQEIILLRKKNIKIKINLISKNKKYLKYFNIIKYLDTNIEIFKNKKIGSNSLNLNKVLNKKVSYSLENIITKSSANKIKPKLIFKKKYVTLVRNKLKKKKISKFVCIHIKESKKKVNLKELNSWKNLIKFISKKFLIIFLSSNSYKKYFIKNKNILFISFKNIYSEPILSQICKFYLASASGFCSFAIFSDVPYLIIKKPREHVDQIKKEIKFNRLKFASNKQFLIREKMHNIKKILNYVKKIE